MNPEEINKVFAEADCLHNYAEVCRAMDEMARAMHEQLHDKNPLMLCVVTGGIIPMGHLMTRLRFPLQVDYIHATRYRGATSGGTLKWLVKPSFPLKDRVVVLVDDVLDAGITLDELIKYAKSEGAKQVYSAVLVEKEQSRPFEIKADFTGIKTVNRYLFGFGMDYKDYLRNADGIYAVKGM